MFRSIRPVLLFLTLAGGAAGGEPAAEDQPMEAAEAAATMQVPDGFRVTRFASEPDVRQPIAMCLDDQARLWVGEAYNYPVKGQAKGDRVIILQDRDGDGHHDTRKVFADGFGYITGIEVGFGGAWVMSPPTLWFVPDRDGDDIPDGPRVAIRDGFGVHANAHNLANALAWGPDGWLYGTHGRTNWSMVGRPGDDESQRRRFDGGVYRYHPVQDVWEPYADGTTNPWGIDWNDYGHAFVTNCVNPHLFQVLQGAHYEPWRGRDSSRYAYERIDTIADHLHYVGLGNVRNGLGSAAEDAAGGGHAHCGTLIYLADAFPAEYRNRLLTHNIHGKRINVDCPQPYRSGYVASHGKDLMRAADPWFVGVTLVQGPAGEIYSSDWSDTGECHHTRNTQRETGRIYRITYGDVRRPEVDLNQASSAALVDYQLHRNDWYVRHARRRLQERAAAGVDLTVELARLRMLLETHPDVTRRLRALWALHACAALQPSELMTLAFDRDPHLRSWAVQLLGERPKVAITAVPRLCELAEEERDPMVRLALAIVAQRLPAAARWDLLRVLSGYAEDADDPNLPLMLWYAMEPLVLEDAARFLQLGFEAEIPRLREHTARRFVEARDASVAWAPSGRGPEARLGQLITVLRRCEVPADRWEAMLRGIEKAVAGQRFDTPPVGWTEFLRPTADQHGTAPVQSIVRSLSVRFGDEAATRQLRKLAKDPAATRKARKDAIGLLAEQRTEGLVPDLCGLLEQDEVCDVALAALAHYSEASIATRILTHFQSMSPENQQRAVETLAARPTWARRLVGALDDGTIDPQHLTAVVARQIDSLGDAALAKRFTAHWGVIRPTDRQAAKQIQAMRAWLTGDVLAEADLDRGEKLYRTHCGNCHRLFGAGGAIGPDLTGAQRRNLDYLLENILAPSATVAEAYRVHRVVTDDGRVVAGLLQEQNAETLTVQTSTERVVLRRQEIESIDASKTSMMPSGLLQPFSDREVRDLIGYLTQ